MSEWIKCTERMPALGSDVLACFKGQFVWVIFTAHMTRHYGLNSPSYAPPTHWQPLPAPPEEA